MTLLSINPAESSGEDWKKSVQYQPYRTAPLVSPAPRTSSTSQYQHFRGPQYKPSPRQQHRVTTLPSFPFTCLLYSSVQNPPLYLRGSSSMTNLHSADGNSGPVTTSSASSTQGSPLFVRHHDSFNNARQNNFNNHNWGGVSMTSLGGDIIQ